MQSFYIIKHVSMRIVLLYFVAALYVLSVNAQPTAGLVAYWRLDGNYQDAGPNLIHGTNAGSTATTNYAFAASKAMAFSNPSSTVPQYATHPVSSFVNFSGTQDFTISFSFYLNSPWIHTGGFYDNNLNYGGPGIWIWSSGGIKIQFNYKNNSLASTVQPVGFWRHVAAVRNGGTLKIYINGVLNTTGTEGTMTPTYPLPARFGTMMFGGYSPPEYNGFNGKLDEFRIYNRALTAAEIVILHAVALPVKLTSFTAVNNNNSIKLQWQTQYEQNSRHYIIQRSTDGVNFTDIDKVAAAGNSDLPLTYNYTDVLPAMLQNKITIFYRLQTFDADGRFFNSPVVAIHLNKKDVQLLVFPNPAKEVLQVQTNGLTGQATLSIIDAAGRQLYTRDILLQQGSNSMPVNIAQFSNGIYYIRLSNGSNNFTKQFVKE